MLLAALVAGCGGRLDRWDEFRTEAHPPVDCGAELAPDGHVDAPILFSPCDPSLGWAACPAPYVCVDSGAVGDDLGCSLYWPSPLCSTTHWVPPYLNDPSAEVCAPAGPP